MAKHQLTKAQAQKFIDGYNAKVAVWNSGTSDFGHSPFRANTWADIGYGAARSQVVAKQLASEATITLAVITTNQAQAVFEAYL